MMVIPNVADGGNWNKEMITVVVLWSSVHWNAKDNGCMEVELRL